MLKLVKIYPWRWIGISQRITLEMAPNRLKGLPFSMPYSGLPTALSHAGGLPWALAIAVSFVRPTILMGIHLFGLFPPTSRDLKHNLNPFLAIVPTLIEWLVHLNFGSQLDPPCGVYHTPLGNAQFRAWTWLVKFETLRGDCLSW